MASFLEKCRESMPRPSGSRQEFSSRMALLCARGSIHQLPDMIRLDKNWGVDRIKVMNLVTYVKSQKYNSLSYHRSLANHYFTESRKIAEELNFDIEIPPNFNTGAFPNSRLSQPTRGSKSPSESTVE